MSQPNPYQSPKSPEEPLSRKRQQLERLDQIHAQGRQRYTLLRGVLGWGILSGVGWSLINWLFSRVDQAPGMLTFKCVTGLITFMVFGYFFGAAMWKGLEEKRTALQQEIADDRP